MKYLPHVSALVFLILALSCEKEDEISPDNPDLIAKRDSIYRQYQNLGSGYDVFDNYADVVKVRGQIFDLFRLHEDNYLEKKTIEKGTFHTVEGKTVSEYLQNFSSKTNVSGSYGFFSGSLSVNYETSQYSSHTNSFATVQSLINKYLLQVKKEYNAENLIPYTTEKFQKDMRNPDLTSDDIFEMYGTHCMRSIITGGRLDFNVTAKESYVSDSKTIGVHARAAFKSLFTKVSIENETVSETEQNEFESHMERNLEVYGGSSEYGQSIINEGDYEEWIASISGNHVFCEYGDDPFIPVWELCEEEARKSELEVAFENWAIRRQYDSRVETIILEYEFADTLFKRVYGDANPATSAGNPVNVEAELNLLLNEEGNIDLTIYFRLREQYGDHTEYSDVHTINNIYEGSVYEIVGIEGDTRCFVGETLWEPINGWTDFKGGCSFVQDYQFLLKGLNCDNNTGVRGKLRFRAYVTEKPS